MTNSDIKVWDPMVRVFHWGLVLSFAFAWITAESWKDMHLWAGYAAAALIGFRLFWGSIGSRYARFTQFVRSPATAKNYAYAMLRGQETRYIGYNPLGGLMVLALLAGFSGTAWSGWMMTLAGYKNSNWLEEAHEFLAGFMLAMVTVHVAGVIFASVRHNENLVRAMFTGRKHSAGPDDVS